MLPRSQLSVALERPRLPETLTQPIVPTPPGLIIPPEAVRLPLTRRLPLIVPCRFKRPVHGETCELLPLPVIVPVEATVSVPL